MYLIVVAVQYYFTSASSVQCSGQASTRTQSMKGFSDKPSTQLAPYVIYTPLLVMFLMLSPSPQNIPFTF